MAPCAPGRCCGRVGGSQPHGNGSHLRPNPRRETIEEPIGIYSSRSTRSDIEWGGAGALRSRLMISRPRRYDLARSRVNRSQPIIRSKRSVYEDVCSTLNRLKTPRWADTARWASALPDWLTHGSAGRTRASTTRPDRPAGARGHARTCESLVPLASRPPPDVARQVAHAALTTRRTL